jgi:hypothetical protein
MTITTIWERLSLGNATDADGLAVLNPLDIRAVVNVNTDANQAKRYGILALPCAKWLQHTSILCRCCTRR